MWVSSWISSSDMPGFHRVAQVPDAFVVGRGQLRANLILARLLIGAPQVLVVATETEAPDFQTSQRLLERLLEGATDGHRFADALHLRRERRVGFRKFLEGKPRDLGHHVVDRRFETGLGFLGDVVGQFLQPIAYGQLGRDLGDRETGRLAGQCTRAADARVHLDRRSSDPCRDEWRTGYSSRPFRTPISRMTASDASRIRWYSLSVKRLRRRNGDRVAGVHAHRVEVFDGADDDDVVVQVAHHLHLVFFPAQDRFFDQHLGDRAIWSSPLRTSVSNSSRL